MGNLAVLKKLTEAFGPSTMEDRVIESIKELLGDRFEYEVTPHKNLVVFPRRGSFERTIVLQAHMDELGFRPYRYRPDGFIELSAMAGIPRAATNALLRFEPGGAHGILLIIPKERGNRFFLDIGARGEKEAQKAVPFHANGAYTGIVFEESETQLLSKSFDDRVGCALAVRALQNWDESSGTRVLGLFTSREETGDWPVPEVYKFFLQQDLMPEFILNLEVCPGGPSPVEQEPLAILDKGVVLTHMDKQYAADSRICRWVKEVAEENGIRHQVIAMREGAGEMGRYALGFGVKGYSLTVPGRYTHSPHSVISKDDYLAALELTRALIEAYPLD